MARILITGGTGLLGTALANKLAAEKHEVCLLSRSPSASSNPLIRQYKWDVRGGFIDPAVFQGLNHVVHLAGAGVMDERWTRELIASRVDSMVLLEQKLLKFGVHLRSFVGASAVGYYGMVNSPKIFSEEDKPFVNDFLVQCCQAWENAYNDVRRYAGRKVILRIGVVLDAHGGALGRLLPLFRMGLGSALGKGSQHMTWIHIHDMVELLYKSIFDESMQGTYNAVAPQHLTNTDFSKALARALHKSLWMPAIPAPAMRTLLGERADVLLKGPRVSAEKLLQAGFRFNFPDIDSALADLFRK